MRTWKGEGEEIEEDGDRNKGGVDKEEGGESERERKIRQSSLRIVCGAFVIQKSTP